MSLTTWASLDETTHKPDQKALSRAKPGRLLTEMVLALKTNALLTLNQAFVCPNVRRKGRPQVGEARLWTSP